MNKLGNILRKKFLLFGIFVMCSFPCLGAETEIIQRAESYYNVVKSVCSGISDSVSKVSGVAKTNTAVNTVGTVASGGALAVGIAKKSVDSHIEELMNKLCSIGGCDTKKIENMDDEQTRQIIDILAQIKELDKEIKNEQKRSKTLGDWRTGLMASNIATNIVSAIIAGINRDKSELIQQIQACNSAVKSVNEMNHDLKNAGISSIGNPIVNKLNSVATWCGNLDEKNIERIEKQMGAVMGTSIAGATVGTVGVATSAVANSDKTNDDKKSLNITANVLSGINVATGAVGIGLNISMINNAKNIIKQSERCEEVLR